MLYFENPEILITALPLSLIAYVLLWRTGFTRVFARMYRVYHPLVGFARLNKFKRSSLRSLVLPLLFLTVLVIALSKPYIIVEEKVPVVEKGVGSLSFTVKPPVILVVDVSGSMEGKKLSEAKKALKTFVETINNSLDIGLIAFDGMIVEAVPPISNTSYVLEVIDSLNAGGGTMYSYPLRTAYEWLKPYREFNIPVSIVFASDGLPADLSSARKVIDEYYVRENIRIYGVFIGNEPEGYMVIQEMCNKTGGRSFQVEDIDELVETYRELAREVVNTTLSNVTVKLTSEKVVEKKYFLTSELSMLSLVILLISYYVNYRRYRITF